MYDPTLLLLLLQHYNFNATPQMNLQLAHRRYTQQAEWTAQLRRHIFACAGLPNARRVLEVGCGTGAVLASFPLVANARLFGIDIDRQALTIAKTHTLQSQLACGNAHALPYGDGFFDITFFHYVLLWLVDPIIALIEARRVTRPGGAVVAFAEPDYSIRQDSPIAMAALGRLQTEALRHQGADIATGSRLPELFAKAGLYIVESGPLEPTDDQKLDPLELEVIRSDLANLASSRSPGFSRSDIDQLLDMEETAGYRTMVPTFFCWGLVP